MTIQWKKFDYSDKGGIPILYKSVNVLAWPNTTTVRFTIQPEQKTIREQVWRPGKEPHQDRYVHKYFTLVDQRDGQASRWATLKEAMDNAQSILGHHP